MLITCLLELARNNNNHNKLIILYKNNHNSLPSLVSSGF